MSPKKVQVCEETGFEEVRRPQEKRGVPPEEVQKSVGWVKKSWEREETKVKRATEEGVQNWAVGINRNSSHHKQVHVLPRFCAGARKLHQSPNPKTTQNSQKCFKRRKSLSLKTFCCPVPAN